MIHQSQHKVEGEVEREGEREREAKAKMEMAQVLSIPIPKFFSQCGTKSQATMKLGPTTTKSQAFLYSYIGLQTRTTHHCGRGRGRGGVTLTCHAAASGLQVSVADSQDSVCVKKAHIVVQSQDNDKIQLRVDLSGIETQRVFDLVLTNLARTAPPIPGFRKDKGGKTTKVPKSFLLGALGEERVTNFVLQDIVISSIAQYIKNENLKVKEDKVNTTQSAEELKASFKPGSDFGFNAIIELQSSEVVETVDSETTIPIEAS